jgi:hypothetical protein
MGDLITVDFISRQRPSAATELVNTIIETLELEDFADFAAVVLSGSDALYRQLDPDMQDIVCAYRELIAQ